MIEQKLIVGRYIELNTPPPMLNGASFNNFQLLHAPVLHIAESSSKSSPIDARNPVQGFNPGLGDRAKIEMQRAGRQIANQFNRQQTSQTQVGASDKAHRNFRWLEWLPGKVSEVNPGGMDVLTGPMSGCWIVSYLRNGVRRVGHVGTDMDAMHPNTVAAKAAWNNFAALQPPGSCTGFDPFNDAYGLRPAALPGESALKTFALVTAGGQFYTLFAYPQVNKASRIRIAGLHQLPGSLPLNGQI